MKVALGVLILALMALGVNLVSPFVGTAKTALLDPHYEMRPIRDEWVARWQGRMFENDINRMTLVCPGEDPRPLHMLDHHGLDVPALEIARHRYHPKGCKVYHHLCSRPGAGNSKLCAG